MDIREPVGRNARNNPSDVRTVQQLLIKNGGSLIPLAPVMPSGFCDSPTISAIETFQRRVVGMQNPTGRVDPGDQTLNALNGVCAATTVTDKALDEALQALRNEALNFGQRFIQDAGVRADYVAKAEQVSQEILEMVQKGELTPKEAAYTANEMRNGLMDVARINNSDIGQAVSFAEKSTGLTMDELLGKYSRRLFQREFSQLGTAEQDAVFLEIVRASGRPNPRFTGLARGLGKAGKGLLVVSIAFAVYDISTSERPGREAVKQGVTAGTGFLGSLAGGAVAGLACGPGAPICVGVGVFVGGLLFGLGADFAFDDIWE